MARSSHRRSRRTGQRKYKRIFDLVCEGVKTEPEYFNWVSENLDNDAVRLNIISKKPGADETITGRPIAMASRAETPKLSDRLGETKISSLDRASGTWELSILP